MSRSSRAATSSRSSANNHAVLAHELLPGQSSAVDLAAMIGLTAVFGYLGLHVLRMTDERWSDIREWRRAFRPMPDPPAIHGYGQAVAFA